MSVPIASHQTVRLERGRHGSPNDGVCVMELASMLAGEHFTDSPASVCPVVAAFMRTYNDAVDDARRQDLYGFAARAVGTADDGHARRRRALCRDLADSLEASRGGRFKGWRARLRASTANGTRAAKLLARESDRHPAALTFLAELIGGDRIDLELGAIAGHGQVVSTRPDPSLSSSRQAPGEGRFRSPAAGRAPQWRR
jgi:hypothetical protein